MDPMRLVAAVMVACAISGSVSAADGSSADSVEQRHAQLKRVDESSAGAPQGERLAAITAEYEQSFRNLMSGDSLRSVGDTDLAPLYQAAYMAAFYSHASAHLEDMHAVLAEKERRGIATDEERSQILRALVGYRRLEEARAYALAHPAVEAEALPTVRTAGAATSDHPRVFRVSEDGFELIEERVDLSDRATLVVIAHPLCGFSRRAMEAIASDPALAASLPEQVVWLAPVDFRLNVQMLQRWNTANPWTPLRIAYSRDDWPALDSWSTPTFHLFENGVLVGQLSGWPQQGNRDALMALLAQRRESAE
jgi:hypothetical protein